MNQEEIEIMNNPITSTEIEAVIKKKNLPKNKRESEIAQSCQTLATPLTAAHQAPPSMGFPGKSTGVGCHWE